jgi:hypothetical protein
MYHTRKKSMWKTAGTGPIILNFGTTDGGKQQLHTLAALYERRNPPIPTEQEAG